MKYIILFIVCLLIALPAYAAENAKKKNAVVKWNPSVFSDDKELLPKNYSGLDAKKFYNLFKSKIANLEKGDFETSDDYEKRTKNINYILTPINTTDLYAFKIPFDKATYNADSQVFSIKTYHFGGSLCEALIQREEDEWVTCKVAAVKTDKGKYYGSNAYGASTKIIKNHITYFALAIPKNNLFLNDKFKVEKGVRGYNINGKEGYREIRTYDFNDELPILIEKAKSLKKTEIAGLVVGRITDAKVIQNLVDSSDPTFDSPFDRLIMYEAIPFEVKRIIYYAVQTGEILYQKSY